MPVKLATRMAAKNKKKALDQKKAPVEGFQLHEELRNTEAIDKLIQNTINREACEIVANVTFWGKNPREQSLVMFEDLISKRHVENAAVEFKTMKQDDLMKKGLKTVPIWEFGHNTREALAKCQMYTLIGDKAVKEREAARKAELKKAAVNLKTEELSTDE